jgi:putative DNA methylase
MVWDYAESNPFADAGGSLYAALDKGAMAVEAFPASVMGFGVQQDAARPTAADDKLVSTDPPYFDNIGYADLSDFFYVWIRRSLRHVFPDVLATLAVPKSEELVATPYRHGSKEKAEAFFLQGMTRAMRGLAERGHPAFPATVFYAFRQSETDSAGTASTGWETFLEAVIRAGFGITGTWPMRTEGAGRILARDTNALASSIVLVCRRRSPSTPTGTRREFVARLKNELPSGLVHLQRGNIAPVDVAQAAIGPGMAIYTQYSEVLDAEGKPVSVRDALALINQTIDEIQAEQEGDFDADSRFALAWYEQQGFSEGEFDDATKYARAKNTGMNGLEASGIIESRRGKVRLLKPEEVALDDAWDPATEPRLTAWKMVHWLVGALQDGAEPKAAHLVVKLGARAEVARELAYRLYTLADRNKRASEALSYNALVQSWPEITRLAREGGQAQPQQQSLFEEAEE